MDKKSMTRLPKANLVRAGLLTVAMAFAVGAGSASAQTLPPPNTVVDGVPVAIQYDDFFSYSTRVLNYLYPTDGWDASAGTGLLDVLITTRSSGQTNSGGALAPYNIPDPTTNPNSTPIVDSWGTTDTTGTMLVLDLYNYLQDTFQASIPVFTFDQNETGGNPNLLVSAKVEIIDPNTGVLATWALDAIAQASGPAGVYDPLSPITAPGETCIDPDSAPVQCFNNNVGSGKFDFILFAPTMNLANYTGLLNDPLLDNIFKVSWEFAEVDDGGEEITLTGRFTGEVCPNPDLPQCQTIPEPGSLALLAVALASLGVTTGRRKSRS
jgi:PEP-CTERM motif-containing protein